LVIKGALLMKIDEISEYVWLNSKRIEFGGVDVWDENLFLSKWAKGKPIEKEWAGIGAGWYWFLVKMKYDELHTVVKPTSLPAKGCDIGLLTRKNKDLFGLSLLCASESDITVIYNGHEGNVRSRLRAHFSLKNNQTGALGIKHYPLSNETWIVRYFSSACFTDISASDKSRIELLMKSYTGRCAVESAWRVKYGWPALCKE
jgi:hypothetical protein